VDPSKVSEGGTNKALTRHDKNAESHWNLDKKRKTSSKFLKLLEYILTF